MSFTSLIDQYENVLALVDPMAAFAVANRCKDKASGTMASHDAEIENTINTWKPSGFYTVTQFEQILNFTIGLQSAARNALTTAMNDGNLAAHRAVLSKAEGDLASDPRLNPTVFVDAIRTAKSQGIDVIEAQGFRRFVLANLTAAREVWFWIFYVQCARPLILVSAMNAIGQAFDALLAVLKAAKDAIVAAGQAILKIPDLLSTIFSVLKVIPWVVLIGGGYWVGVKSGVIPQRYVPAKLRESRHFQATWGKHRQLTGVEGTNVPKVGQLYKRLGDVYEVTKVFRDKKRTVQLARRVRDPFGKEVLIDHRSAPAAELDRDYFVPMNRQLTGGASPIAPVLPKWKRAIANYRRKLAELEDGSTTDISAAVKARDRLDKIVGEAAGYAPGSYLDPAVEALNREVDALPKIGEAADRGRRARADYHASESRRVREEQRKANEPYAWMDKRSR